MENDRKTPPQVIDIRPYLNQADDPPAHPRGKAARRYIRQVRRALACPGRERRQLSARIGEVVGGFSQENPGAGYDDYVGSFGPPEDFARDVLAQLDPEEVAGFQKRRTLLRWGIVAAVIAVLAVTSIFGCYKWAQLQKLLDSDILITVEIGEAKVISGEEAYWNFRNSSDGDYLEWFATPEGKEWIASLDIPESEKELWLK